MSTADYSFYTRLEPNHDVEVDDEGYQTTVCPWDFNDAGQLVLHDHPVVRTATWSPNADPEEVDCPVCEVIFHDQLHYAGPPAHAGEPDDGPPEIAGGAHGAPHRVTEWQACKVPLRRVTWCRVQVTMHEGLVSKVMAVSDEYERRIAAGEKWRVRQADTAFYVCRRISGSSSWSKHSWGCAGDINWQTAPYGTRRRDHPAWFVAAMKRCGMGDGIEWSKPDPMHYSAFVNEGGDGWLYVGTIDEEDEMTPEDWKTLDGMLDEKLKAYVGDPYTSASGTKLKANNMLAEKEGGEFVDGVKLAIGLLKRIASKLGA